MNNLPNLTHLKVGNSFNQPLNNLPGLTYLTLGDSFTQPFDNLPNLTHLTCNNFNKILLIINFPIMPKLTHLILTNFSTKSCDFNFAIKFPNLAHLTFSYNTFYKLFLDDLRNNYLTNLKKSMPNLKIHSY